MLRGTFWCGFSWSSATPGAHLESAACCLQLLGNSCFLPCVWDLVGGKQGQPEDGFALGSTEADTLLSACGFTWGRVWLYFRHLLNQTEPFSSSPNPSKGPVCLCRAKGRIPGPMTNNKMVIKQLLKNNKMVIKHPFLQD